MIKLKKLSLLNFKGIKSKVVFEFSNDDAHVNVLSGPNGFGKTTIFDVIEICLTGEFKRVEYFDNVQKKNTNRNKPFFQNTDDEDVVLKIWLYNTTTQVNYIIIKHYDDDTAPKKITQGRHFIPSDASKLFVTYLSQDVNSFDLTEFSTLEPVDQSVINSLFFDSNSIVDLKSTYYLFNYIQQEDSIYFLRKNEDDKGASLGFLFNIQREESEKQKLLSLRDQLTNQKDTIERQIEELTNSLPNSQKGEYVKLFVNKEVDFDKEYPFSQIAPGQDQLGNFQRIIESLIKLRNEFSLDEYEKSLKFRKLNDAIIGDNSILSAILVRKVYNENLLTNLDEKNYKIVSANRFLNTSNSDFISKDYFDVFLPAPIEYSTYLAIENSIKEIDKDLGSIGRIISDLNGSRNQTREKFVQLKDSGHVSDINCPLCDHQFETFEILIRNIENKTSLIESFNSEKLSQKNRLEDEIKLFHARITEIVNTFLGANKTTEPSVLSLLREYPTLKEKIDDLFNMYPTLNSSSMDSINFIELPTTIDALRNNVTMLREFLHGSLLSELIYNEQLIDNKHLYLQYFDGDRNKFTSVSADMLAAKLTYLQGSYVQIANSRLVFLETRNQKLANLLDRISPIFENLHRTIQDHKVEMIEKIKVPFYIYSGKILQSYQQGLGIFVRIHATGQNNNVLFKTGHSSDHDIVYHLSSGQMAVVSLAFCLSLNKVYNTNDNFKFLSIDDPIQTMDDLNIHTFIELIRNEFKDYQIIMSTHDDFTSRYMKYKFDKFEMNTEIQNVQKIVLEQSLN